MYQIRNPELDTWSYVNLRDIEAKIDQGYEVYREDGTLWKKPYERLTEEEKESLNVEIEKTRIR
ncbi:hypothetical protein [Blautia marasmi]|uniref:hypothetical protein n=1 Tax=Blautia marasmi TaxID=1917868 RepID=UPI00266DCC61|nr:hypothetical protein [Blautia marasmi]